MIAAGLWWLSCLPEALAFQRATSRVEETQRTVLARLLKVSGRTWFARRHRLEGVDSFRERVPLSHYEDYAEAIERIATGEQGVLSADPVLLFEPTGGSLGGPRLIPYTAGLKRDFQRALAPWIVDLFGRRPALFRGRSYWSISPPGQRSRHGVIPVGFDDDTAYLGSVTAALVRSLLAVPELPPGEDFLRATLERLVACPDLTLVSVWSPTFWLRLTEGLEGRNPWPRLSCISCWGDAYSERYLEPLQRRFPGAAVQKKGLLSTEAFTTFPLWGREGGALALRSHFFEFLDERGEHLAHQLDLGRVYEVVVTTSGGLYRYRTGDLVRVVGALRDCPMLRFEGRRGVVDRFGEKISYAEAAAALPPRGLAMLAFDSHGYVLFGEGVGNDDAATAERSLCRSFTYRTCRELGQLGAVRAFRLEKGALEAFYARLEQLGVRSGDAKPLPVRPESDWAQHLPGAFCIPSRVGGEG